MGEGNAKVLLTGFGNNQVPLLPYPKIAGLVIDVLGEYHGFTAALTASCILGMQKASAKVDS